MYHQGLIILADGFEDTEALTTRDILLRGAIIPTTVSINKTNEVTSSFGVKLFADKNIDNIDSIDEYSFIILPGGGRGVKNLSLDKRVLDLVKKFAEQNKLVCAICAAPSILGEMGLLKDKQYTCYAGFNKDEYGLFNNEKPVIKDGNIITARSMEFSIDFGLKIIQSLLGDGMVRRVKIMIHGLSEK